METMAHQARLPRVARLMALAIKYQGMVSRGELVDYADIARLGYVTTSRATQVMNSSTWHRKSRNTSSS